jgi:phage head maturation protease
MHLYGPLIKIDREQRRIWGYASTQDVDSDGEIVLKSAIEAALDDYMKFANVREMHALSAVGTAEKASVDDKGLYITAKIVDDVAWKKVVEGVYKGFSIGGKVLARDPDNRKIITSVRLDEISIVDRPGNPKAVFDIWKAAGARDPAEVATAGLDTIERNLRPDPADLIMKAFAAKDAEIDRLNKRIDELLAEPLPPKTAGAHAVFAVSKEDDAGGAHNMRKAAPAEEDLVAALQAMPEEERALLLIKASQQLPRPVRMGAP